MEQRAYPRLDVKARCHLMGSRSKACEGVTENISRSGLLMRLRTNNSTLLLPKIGELMTVDIELPRNKKYGQKCLRCRGAVVRVINARKSSPRIALSIGQMRFYTNSHALIRIPDDIDSIEHFLERGNKYA